MRPLVFVWASSVQERCEEEQKERCLRSQRTWVLIQLNYVLSVFLGTSQFFFFFFGINVHIYIMGGKLPCLPYKDGAKL